MGIKDFLGDWLRGIAVCAGCAAFANLGMLFVGQEQIEWWRQAAFVLGAPLVVAAFMSFASWLAPSMDDLG